MATRVLVERSNERSNYFIAFASSETIYIAVKIYRSPKNICHEENERRTRKRQIVFTNLEVLSREVATV